MCGATRRATRVIIKVVRVNWSSRDRVEVCGLFVMLLLSASALVIKGVKNGFGYLGPTHAYSASPQ